MYIIIGADFVPTSSNESLFSAGASRDLFGDGLLKVLEDASFRIFNLEVPLTDSVSPIIKQGPNLVADRSTIEGYKAVSVDLLTLANNHILDQGVAGMRTTIDVLEQANIGHVGVGANASEAAKPYIFDFANKKIGVYACVEHEFSVAGADTPGANPFDPLYSLDHVEALKREADYVIVLYHGGKEHYRYPSPNLQRVCRRLVDKGADLVLCQHSHCIGCEEKYGQGTIVYGQGNFLFDHRDNEYWNTGMLVGVDEDWKVFYRPLTKTKNTVRLANDRDAEQIMREFDRRSEEIRGAGFVERRYERFADEFFEYYCTALMGRRSVPVRALNRLTGGRAMRKLLRKKYDAKALVRIENYINCEAHRELMLTMIQSKRR